MVCEHLPYADLLILRFVSKTVSAESHVARTCQLQKYKHAERRLKEHEDWWEEYEQDWMDGVNSETGSTSSELAELQKDPRYDSDHGDYFGSLLEERDDHEVESISRYERGCGRKLDILFCVRCCTYKDKTGFSNTQFRQRTKDRHCLRCSRRSGHVLTADGRKGYNACFHCGILVYLDEDYYQTEDMGRQHVACFRESKIRFSLIQQWVEDKYAAYFRHGTGKGESQHD